MSEWTETVRAMLEKSTPGPWECDERVGCISVHPMQIANCICDVVDQVAYWNGFMEDGKWDVKESDSNNAKLIAAAPTLLREACERIEKLEKVAEAARAMRFDGPNVYGAMEVSSGKETVTSLQDALSALDSKE